MYHLRDERVYLPRILVVLCVPGDVAQWLHQTPEQMVLRRSAYWVSLRGWPESENEKRQVVHIPRAQPFTVEALTRMMTRVGEGGLP